MRKHKLLSLALAALFVVQAGGCSSEPDVSSMTALEVVEDMGNGWNLANTMEAWGSWLGSTSTVYDYEKCWGMPNTTKEIIDGVKANGFGSVRIPAAWSNMISDDGSYTIDPTYLARVKEVADFVLDDGMYAIVNIHWDGGWWEDFGSTDEAVRAEAMVRFKAMWTQIADYFKDCSCKLIFESANEDLGSAFESALGKDGAYEKTNEINQAFVDLVRASGGNNAKRFLLIAGYNTDFVKTCNERFKMPADTIENHLMISVHYYTPPTYCIANSVLNSWGYMDSWGTDEDKAEMRQYFEKMKQFTDQGYGVIIGEYGVTKIQGDLCKVPKEGTAAFFASVVELSEEMNYCPMLWDANDWYSRTDFKFNYDDVATAFAAKPAE